MTQPEKPQTFELGASYDTSNIFREGDTFAIKDNLYKTALWDITSYSDVASVDTTGLELEAFYAMETGLYIDMNASIVDGTAVQSAGSEVDCRGIPADSLQLTLGKGFGEEFDLSWERVGNKRFENDPEIVAGSIVHNAHNALSYLQLHKPKVP